MTRKIPSWARWRVVRTHDVPRRWTFAVVGLAASLAIHLLAFEAILRSQSGPDLARSREGIGANAVGEPEEAITTAFFIEDGSAAQEDTERFASAGKLLQSLRVTIVSPDSSLAAALRDDASDEHSTTTDESSVQAREARAALYGRYIGQIEARVKRAWLRPRTLVGADSFECRVQVLQSAQGDVQEVTLQDCNGSPEWQMSLVKAIEHASPLPAPPDPAVFASSILLTFAAAPWRPGSEPGLYELETPQPSEGRLSLMYLSEGH